MLLSISLRPAQPRADHSITHFLGFSSMRDSSINHLAYFDGTKNSLCLKRLVTEQKVLCIMTRVIIRLVKSEVTLMHVPVMALCRQYNIHK